MSESPVGSHIEELDRQITSTVTKVVRDFQRKLGERVRESSEEILRRLEEELEADVPKSFISADKISGLVDSMMPSPPAPSASPAEELLAAIGQVDSETSQAEILKALVRESGRFVARRAFLLVRAREVRGFAGAGWSSDVSWESLGFAVPGEGPWVDLVQGTGAVRLGAESCRDFAARVRADPGVEGILIPFVLRGQLAGTLFADRTADAAAADFASLQLLTHAAAQALETMAFRDRGVSPALRVSAAEAAESPAAGPPEEEAAAELAAVEQDPEPAALEPSLAVEPAPTVEPAPAPSAFEAEPDPSAFEAEPDPSAFEAEPDPSAFEAEPDPSAFEAGPDPSAFEAEPDPSAFEAEPDPSAFEAEPAAFEAEPGVEPEPAGLEAEPAFEPAPEEPGHVEPENAVDVLQVDATPVDGAPGVFEEPEHVEPPTYVEPVVEETVEAGPPTSDAAVVPEDVAPVGVPGEESIWEEDDEPTVIGQKSVIPPAEAPPAVPGIPPGLSEEGQQTVRLDISQLQGQPEQPAPGFELEPEAPAAAGFELEPEALPPPEAPAPPVEPPAQAIPDVAMQAPPTQVQPPPDLAPTQVQPPADPAPTQVEPTADVGHPPSFVSPPPKAEPLPSPPPPASPPAAGSTQVNPPADLDGPGLAFASPDPAAAVDTGIPAGEEALHEEARRLARLLVSEIKLYNEEVIEEGRMAGNIYSRLKEDIDRSRQMYNERIDPRIKEDYFYQELVQRLAGGDPKLLGM